MTSHINGVMTYMVHARTDASFNIDRVTYRTLPMERRAARSIELLYLRCTCNERGSFTRFHGLGALTYYALIMMASKLEIFEFTQIFKHTWALPSVLQSFPAPALSTSSIMMSDTSMDAFKETSYSRVLAACFQRVAHVRKSSRAE
jgi:hypothetical protein